MGYTLAVLGGTKNKYEVDKVEVEHHGALLPDDMLKISISSSDLGKFNKEEGAWVFQDTGETVGVKVINSQFLIREFSGANVPIGIIGQRFVF